MRRSEQSRRGVGGARTGGGEGRGERIERIEEVGEGRRDRGRRAGQRVE
jgi:hypothetical protein